MNFFQTHIYDETKNAFLFGGRGHMSTQHDAIDLLYEQKKETESIICCHFNPYQLSSADILIDAYTGSVITLNIPSIKTVISIEYAKCKDTIGNSFNHLDNGHGEQTLDYAYPHLHFHICVDSKFVKDLIQLDQKINSAYSATPKACLTEAIRTREGYKKYVSDQLEDQLKDKVLVPETRTWNAYNSTKELIKVYKHFREKRIKRKIGFDTTTPLHRMNAKGALKVFNQYFTKPLFNIYLRFFDDS